MAKINAILNNIVTAPMQNSDIRLDFSFGDDGQTATVVSEFLAEFKQTFSEDTDAIAFIDKWITNESPLQKIPTDLDFPKVGRIPGFLVVGANENQFRDRPKEYDVKWSSNIDNFTKLAEKTKLDSFVTNAETRITRAFVEKEDPVEIALAYVGAYLAIKEAKVAVYQLADSVKEFVSTGFDSASAVIKGALKVAMNLVYAGAILFALNELLKNVSDLLFDPPRAYRAIKVFDTIKKGCQELGFVFDSSLAIGEYRDLTLLLSTNYEGRLAGNPNYDYLQETTIADLFSYCSELFNAKARVSLNKVVRFENVATYEENSANIQLKNLYNEGNYSFRTEELPIEIALNYLPSLSDEKYPRRTYKEIYDFVGAREEGANNKKLTVNFNTQIANRKDKQSVLERVFSTIFDLFAGLNKSYKPNLGKRKGYLRTTNRGIPANLIYLPDGDKVNKKSVELLKSKTLFDKFYTNERPENAQFKWYQGRSEESILNDSDVFELTKNNIVKNGNGDTVILTSSVFDPSQEGLMWSFSWKERLNSGDFGYIGKDKFKTKVVEYNG